MNGGRDWRRREAEQMDSEDIELTEKVREDIVEGRNDWEKSDEKFSAWSKKGCLQGELSDMDLLPKRYILSSIDSEKWKASVIAAFSSEVANTIPWEATTLPVYGRKVAVPKHFEGVTSWKFSDLCGGLFGPADYISLASTFHTLVLEEIPVLGIQQKNEARRFITLLDALYEARCKLIIQAEAGPDDLFFPDAQVAQFLDGVRAENDGGDAVYPETLSEIYQDQTSPFRPNISSYIEDSRSGYAPDEDSDFGPIGKGSEIGHGVDFGNTNRFTGEDERFAYKRASSRLWEMCGARWHARSEPGWWKPVPHSIRRWEKSSSPILETPHAEPLAKGDVKLGETIDLDLPAGLQREKIEGRALSYISPFREAGEPAPKIAWTHAWGMIKWGKRAGVWGQGPDALGKRNGGKQ